MFYIKYFWSQVIHYQPKKTHIENKNKLNINVRPAFFYTKAFVYNSVAISLIRIKLLHHTVQDPSIYCVKFQGWMSRTF